MMRHCFTALLASVLIVQGILACGPPGDDPFSLSTPAPGGDSCSPNGTPCVSSCVGLPNGDYQSCHGCDIYATCDHGAITDDRPCPASLLWDDIEKRCEWKSNTCETCPDVDWPCDYQFDLQANDLGESHDSWEIHWSKTPPTAESDPTCSRQGVLRFNLRNLTCVSELRFILKFSDANVGNFSFDIGDSVMDSGWGGGGSVDAEMHNFGRDVYLFDTSVEHNNAVRIHAVNYVKNIMVRIMMQGAMKEVQTTNFADPGPSMTAKSSGLFTPTLLYLGVNRVINDWDEEPVLDRVGSGLCSACVKIVEC